MKTWSKKLSLLLIAIISVVGVGSAQLNAASISVGSDEASSGYGSADSKTISKSEIRQMNLTVQSATDDWAGYYGNIKSSKVLQDSSGNHFYEWKAGKPSEADYVYATKGATPSSKNLAAVDNPNQLTGEDTGSDSANLTYENSGTFDGLGLSLQTNKTVTESSSSTEWSNWILENEDNQEPVYAANASIDGKAFNSDEIDFQLLLPADESTNYSFYIEL